MAKFNEGSIPLILWKDKGSVSLPIFKDGVEYLTIYLPDCEVRNKDGARHYVINLNQYQFIPGTYQLWDCQVRHSVFFSFTASIGDNNLLEIINPNINQNQNDKC